MAPSLPRRVSVLADEHEQDTNDYFDRGSTCEVHAIRLHDQWAQKGRTLRPAGLENFLKCAEKAYRKAIEWYHKGMDDGDARSALALGNLYRYVCPMGLQMR